MSISRMYKVYDKCFNYYNHTRGTLSTLNNFYILHNTVEQYKTKIISMGEVGEYHYFKHVKKTDSLEILKSNKLHVLLFEIY